MKKFNCYLYGRKFSIDTDHKPLTATFGSKKATPAMAAARLQRWAIFLGAYNYDIKFRLTDAHCNADGLSRLPLSEGKFEGHDDAPGIFNLSQIDCLPVTSTHLKSCTSRDKVLSKVPVSTPRRDGLSGKRLTVHCSHIGDTETRSPLKQIAFLGEPEL